MELLKSPSKSSSPKLLEAIPEAEIIKDPIQEVEITPVKSPHESLVKGDYVKDDEDEKMSNDKRNKIIEHLTSEEFAHLYKYNGNPEDFSNKDLLAILNQHPGFMKEVENKRQLLIRDIDERLSDYKERLLKGQRIPSYYENDEELINYIKNYKRAIITNLSIEDLQRIYNEIKQADKATQTTEKPDPSDIPTGETNIGKLPNIIKEEIKVYDLTEDQKKLADTIADTYKEGLKDKIIDSQNKLNYAIKVELTNAKSKKQSIPIKYRKYLVKVPKVWDPNVIYNEITLKLGTAGADPLTGRGD